MSISPPPWTGQRKATTECPKCYGRGAYDRRGTEPTTYLCRTCNGTGRVPA